MFMKWAPDHQYERYPDSKVHGANMGPIWGRQDPGGSHVDPMNFAIWVDHMWEFNTSRPEQNVCHLDDDIFKCIFLTNNVYILPEILLKFVLDIKLTINQYLFR